jgi:hypothetical protein
MNVRGAGIRSALLAIEQLYGDGPLQEVKAALPQAIRAQLEPNVLPVQWYPVETSAQLHVAVRDVLGKGEWTVSHELGAVASRIDFGGIYRVLVRAAPYDSIWDRAQRAWQQYNSQGDAKWIERGASSAVGVIRGVHGYNMGLWQSVAGRTEGMLQMAGVKAASVTVVEGTAIGARIEAIWVA